MRKVSELYTNPSQVDETLGSDGLTKIAEIVNEKAFAPRKKVTVMFIGNHSAGKSSFINWYIGDNIMPTGVAVESQGFTICTQGKNKDNSEIKGEGTLRYFPHIAGIDKFGKTLIENLNTSVSPSSKHRFDVVDLIDTPGMVDGNVKYPFDVDAVIEYLAGHVDIICVFLDPIGQALCSRTMNVVERLNKNHYEKMRYYITKADTVDRIIDLFKVSQQVTQNLAQRVNNSHGFSVPPIFIPTEENKDNELSQINQVQELLSNIDRAIKQKVQDNLKTLETHCSKITNLVKSELHANTKASEGAGKRNVVALIFLLLGLTALLVLPIYYFEHVDGLAGGEIQKNIPYAKVLHGHISKYDQVPVYILSFFAVCSLIAYIFRWLAGRFTVMSAKDVALRTSYVESLTRMKQIRDELFEQFYNETVPSEFGSDK